MSDVWLCAPFAARRSLVLPAGRKIRASGSAARGPFHLSRRRGGARRLLGALSASELPAKARAGVGGRGARRAVARPGRMAADRRGRRTRTIVPFEIEDGARRAAAQPRRRLAPPGRARRQRRGRRARAQRRLPARPSPRARFRSAWRRARSSTRPRSCCGGAARARSTSRSGAPSRPISSPR